MFKVHHSPLSIVNKLQCLNQNVRTQLDQIGRFLWAESALDFRRTLAMVAEYERTLASISPPSASEANAARLGALVVEFQLIHNGRVGGSGGPTRTNPPGSALPSGGSGHHHDAQGRAHPA
jgi:hypothetical protein